MLFRSHLKGGFAIVKPPGMAISISTGLKSVVEGKERLARIMNTFLPYFYYNDWVSIAYCRSQFRQGKSLFWKNFLQGVF